MMRTVHAVLTAVLLSGALQGAAATPVDDLRRQYQAEGAGPFDAARGAALWQSAPLGRRCADCHSGDLRGSGKHAKTGKAIEPLAPSVNPKRLSDQRQVRKWLKRNCQWTFDRPCTPQEKGDLLTWLEQQ
ncbi:DUF1924 domain-containing protein [Motiliproteus sp. SC1-56]|uniref:DUF1924 domain-containing protein n=1 Tax=Motiliproteus sp. SC1-56 TaxID=2799565 RepID=UPI001A8FC528|nr:DUF1924 domain-containing protein [Motiliproteus sp. SC1-56]